MLCTVAAAGLALASPAFAAPVVVEDLGSDPNTGISFTPGAGTFDDAFTFSLDAPETLTITAILNTYPLGVEYVSLHRQLHRRDRNGHSGYTGSDRGWS